MTNDGRALTLRPPMNSPSNDWLAPLTSLLGGDKITTAEQSIAEHSTDKWSASHPPDVVVFAESTADVSAVLAFAMTLGVFEH